VVSEGQLRKKQLSIGHLLSHVEKQLAILIVGFAQQAAKLVEVASLFPGGTPRDVVRRLTLGEIGELRRLLAVVEELIKWAFERARQFFERFDGWHCMAIFDAGNVATE